jgi:hypothetical protein
VEIVEGAAAGTRGWVGADFVMEANR